LCLANPNNVPENLMAIAPVPAPLTVAPKKGRAQPTEAAVVKLAAGCLKMGSDPTRLTILRALAAGPLNVTALCRMTAQSQPSCSHHLRLLRASGIIEGRRDGHSNFYALTDRGRSLAAAADPLVESFRNGR
jgi:DNA-binding transcriptional ArsR family regulator